VNENSFAGNDVYSKGATLLHCLRASMDNDTIFKKMLYDFNMEQRFKISTSDDFINFVNQYTGKNYNSLFNKFLKDTGIPILSYKYERKGNDLILKFQWKEVDDGFEMPFSIETTNDKVAYRFVATTTEQEVVLKNTESFNFFNLNRATTNCPHNGFTYYYTRSNN
jgi:aminopeptidase N